jgi:RNA polymerase sigma factor (sigma-70 family)
MMDVVAADETEPEIRLDLRSIEDLYADEYQPMVRLAFLIVGSEAAAEELVHDAFAEVIERWSRIAQPGAYVRRAVVNRCNSRLRRSAVERKHLRSLVQPVAIDAPDAPLIDALRTLPVRQRTVLVMRYFLGATEQEIADAMNVKPETVKSLSSRGLDALRRQVEL